MRHKYRIPPDASQLDLCFASADPFARWADRFFKNRRNDFVPIKVAFGDCVAYTKLPITRLQFRKALTSWANKRGFDLDPVEYRNAGNRVIRKYEVSHGVVKAMEMIYVKEVDNGNN